jgi:ribose-phosphate pyrophosphokinase
VEANVAEVLHVIGEVENHDVLVVDDMIDTAGTLIQTVLALKKNGARRVFAAATHAVLSGPGLDRIKQAPELQQVIVTDTIPLSSERQTKKIKVLSVASLLGKAIRSIHEETSVSSLFV